MRACLLNSSVFYFFSITFETQNSFCSSGITLFFSTSLSYFVSTTGLSSVTTGYFYTATFTVFATFDTFAALAAYSSGSAFSSPDGTELISGCFRFSSFQYLTANISLCQMQYLSILTDTGSLQRGPCCVLRNSVTLRVRLLRRVELSLVSDSYFWKLKMSQMKLMVFAMRSAFRRSPIGNGHLQYSQNFSPSNSALLFRNLLNSDTFALPFASSLFLLIQQQFYRSSIVEQPFGSGLSAYSQKIHLYLSKNLMSDNISFSSNRNSIQKFKVVFVGDQNVGKSSIIARYIRNEFDPTKNPTIGIDFVSKNIAIAGKMIRLQLWDTAGQERFKSLIPSYLKDAHLALVIFDLANLPSAESITKWMDFIRESGRPDIKLYLVGNKCDIESETINETRKMAQELAKTQADDYKEVSAKTSANIDDLFNKVIEDLVAASNKKKEATASTEPPSDKQDSKKPTTIKLDSKENTEVKANSMKGCCAK